jgi:hypothetical protein
MLLVYSLVDTSGRKGRIIPENVGTELKAIRLFTQSCEPTLSLDGRVPASDKGSLCSRPVALAAGAGVVPEPLVIFLEVPMAKSLDQEPMEDGIPPVISSWQKLLCFIARATYI